MKKYKDYFIVTGVTLFIICLVFLLKGIYPFGSNTLIYSDMYEQVTSYLYYFYDAVKGSQSLLIDFSASSGINFFGVICYYILSPFSLLVLLMERSKIYLVMSIIIVCKLLLCNLTCLYMIKYLFKKNNNYLISILLAILYGFSIYSLNYYVITSWIDAMYMLPLIVVGLKKLFDEDKPAMYITCLTISLFLSFYVSCMVLVFIFLLSLFYIRTYYKKVDWFKKVTSLGISTILSVLSSMVIILPTYKQISISARMGYTLESLLNSKLGPITDKISLFLFGPIILVLIILLLKEDKVNKKFLSFYIPSMILLLIPVIIEPVNKLLHFGSYASFTYRFGFITTLFLIIGASYYLNKIRISIPNNKAIFITICTTIIGVIPVIFLTVRKYKVIEESINALTFSKNKMALVYLIVMYVLVLLSIMFIYIVNKGFNKLSKICIIILSLVHITCLSFIYLGIPSEQEVQNNLYNNMTSYYDNYQDIYRYKDDMEDTFDNRSMIGELSSLDHFSSVADASNQKMLRMLGYSSYWVRTSSRGGTKFSDLLLGNKYILNNNGLSIIDENTNFGYLINKDINIKEYDNTFDLQNDIYRSITDNDYLFDVIKNNEDGIFKIKVKGTKEVYLELLTSLDNQVNAKNYGSFNIYVDNLLIEEKYPDKDFNGIIDLGKYKDEEITIKVEYLRDIDVKYLSVGLLDLKKLDNFVKDYKLDYDIKFNENNININIESDSNKILFIPVTYNEGFSATNNGEKVEVLKVFNNYIGIKLNTGENNINIRFIPTYLVISLIISIVSIIVTILLIKLGIFKKLINIKALNYLAKFIYLGLYILILLLIYILPIIVFVISFITHVKI